MALSPHGRREGQIVAGVPSWDIHLAAIRRYCDKGVGMMFITNLGKGYHGDASDGLPSRDIDPSETGIPWQVLSERGHRVVFATSTANPARPTPGW
jgi:hypothetical protein